MLYSINYLCNYTVHQHFLPPILPSLPPLSYPTSSHPPAYDLTHTSGYFTFFLSPLLTQLQFVTSCPSPSHITSLHLPPSTSSPSPSVVSPLPAGKSLISKSVPLMVFVMPRTPKKRSQLLNVHILALQGLESLQFTIMVFYQCFCF